MQKLLAERPEPFVKPGTLKRDLPKKVDETLPNGNTLLTVSSQWGQVPVVAWLLGEGANANKATADGLTPLYLACRAGDLSTAKTLVAGGAVQAGEEVHISYGALRSDATCMHYGAPPDYTKSSLHL